MADYNDSNPFTDSLNQATNPGSFPGESLTNSLFQGVYDENGNVRPPNPWLQGLGLATNGFPIPDAQTLNPSFKNYYLPENQTPEAINAVLNAYTAAQNSSPSGPSLQGMIDSNGNIRPEYMPANPSAAPLWTAINAYLAAQNPQSANLYPNPAPPLTGYEGIVPTPQPPYPTAAAPTGIPSRQPAPPLAMFAGPPAQINALIPTPAQPANNPLASNPPNPFSDATPDAYIYKLLNGTYDAPPFPTNAPTAANPMTQPAVNPLAPTLPQDLSALLSPTTNPYSPDLPQDTTSMMRTANSPFYPDLPQDMSSMMRIANAPSTTTNVPTEFEVNASEFSGGSDLKYPKAMESAYYPGKQVNPDLLGAALPARIKDIRQRMVRITNPENNISVDVPVVDVGTFNDSDPYWTNAEGNFRPFTEIQKAKNMKNADGTSIHPDGIDITPATMEALGIKGDINSRHARLKWQFIPGPPTRPPGYE